ncbi:MAG: 7-cyano-7-deazaguanine synthase [Candidatus Omnitrophota bacterium]
MNPKAVSLLSGGLDSTLATKIVLNQGIEVAAIHFSLPWGCCNRSAANEVARRFGISLMVLKLCEDYVEMIRNPKYGYGRAMNPCVDCRIYMYRKARKYMETIGASFLITGEVLGQRPKSQMRDSLRIIERECGLSRLILRPLSAKLLEPTIPEELGVVDRSKLLDISGRSRRMQMALAAEEGIREYPTPAGGCLLTDENFSRRLKDLFGHRQDVTVEEMELLRIGRHFRLNPGLKAVVGRNESENELLEYYGKTRPLFHPVNFPGPSTLVLGELDLAGEQMVAGLIYRYSATPRNGKAEEVVLSGRNGEHRYHPEDLLSKEALETMRI